MTGFGGESKERKQTAPFDNVTVTSSESKQVKVNKGKKNKTRRGNIDSFDISQGVPLTICNKMLRHVEGDLDGERARVLCCIDDGNDTRADGNQCQGDLVQRTVEVAWRKEERTRVKKNTGGGVKQCFIWDLCQVPTE